MTYGIKDLDSSIYQGEIDIFGNACGEGLCVRKSDGGVYLGTWKDDQLHGFGILTWPDGITRASEMREGKYFGKHTYWKNNYIINKEFVENEERITNRIVKIEDAWFSSRKNLKKQK